MDTVMIYEVFYFFEVIQFLKSLNFEWLEILKIIINYRYIPNITFKQFSKWRFTLWFYNFIKDMGKRKEDDTFPSKKK